METPAIRDKKNPKYKEVQKVSSIKQVTENAKSLYGPFGTIYLSTQKKKKFMIKNPLTNKWVHFGELAYEDFTKHKDPERRARYLKRAFGIKGKWMKDPFSANNLAIYLRW